VQQIAVFSARITSISPLNLYGINEIGFMTEMDDIQRRWRELAEQLGLPPETADQPAQATPPTTSAQSPKSSLIPEIEDRPVPDPTKAQKEPEELVKVASREMAAPVTEPAMEVEERRPNRGRRRGRRGGRAAEASTVESVEPETAVEAPPADDVSGVEETVEATPAHEQSRRRRRGRARPRRGEREEPETTVAEDEDERDEPEETPESVTDGDEDDDGDDMSSWEIPSWQELIDSLYRPDR
jgi:hypothetical protein